jgi:hypothetical protein
MEWSIKNLAHGCPGKVRLQYLVDRDRHACGFDPYQSPSKGFQDKSLQNEYSWLDGEDAMRDKWNEAIQSDAGLAVFIKEMQRIWTERGMVSVLLNEKLWSFMEEDFTDRGEVSLSLLHFLLSLVRSDPPEALVSNGCRDQTLGERWNFVTRILQGESFVKPSESLTYLIHEKENQKEAKKVRIGIHVIIDPKRQIWLNFVAICVVSDSGHNSAMPCYTDEVTWACYWQFGEMQWSAMINENYCHSTYCASSGDYA